MVFFGACEGLPFIRPSRSEDVYMMYWTHKYRRFLQNPFNHFLDLQQTCKLRCELLTHLPKLTRTVPMLGFLHPDDQMSILYHRVPDISSVNTNLPVVSPRFHHRIRWSTCFSPQWVKQTPSVRKTIQLLCLEILLHHCWAPMYGWYTKGFPWQTPTSAIWLVVSTHPRNVITNYHPSNCSHESNPNLPKFGKVISSTEFQPYDFVLVAFFEHVQRCSKPSHAHHAPWGTSPRALVASGAGHGWTLSSEHWMGMGWWPQELLGLTMVFDNSSREPII